MGTAGVGLRERPVLRNAVGMSEEGWRRNAPRVPTPSRGAGGGESPASPLLMETEGMRQPCAPQPTVQGDAHPPAASFVATGKWEQLLLPDPQPSGCLRVAGGSPWQGRDVALGGSLSSWRASSPLLFY